MRGRVPTICGLLVLAFALGADLPFAIVMTVFYLWRRDLLANILAHSGGLVVSLVTLPSSVA